MPRHTPQFYIAKFSAIPDEQWITKAFEDETGTKHCALGHCGLREHNDNVDTRPDEADDLVALFRDTAWYASVVNDRPVGPFQQSTPKARILAALHYIKEKQCPPSPSSAAK